MENNGPKLVCRKCQGLHLTIKCGKETKSVIANIINKTEEQKFNKHEEYQKPYEKRDNYISNHHVKYESVFKNKDFNNKDFNNKDFNNKDFNNNDFKHTDHKHTDHKHTDHKHTDHKHTDHKHNDHKHNDHKHTDHKHNDHKHNDHKHNDHKHNDHKQDRRPLHKVKMSNLPVDMSEEELYELLYEWGHVVRMRLLNYESNSTAYIEFKDKEPAEYIVKALDKTPFEHIMLDVERLYD